MSFTIVPSIDLRDGRVVRLKQGDFAQQINYDLDPLVVARSFAQAGATLMHVVDLDGAKAGHVMQARLIGEIAQAAQIPVQAGGGVRSSQDILQLLERGVSRVVVGTAAFADWDWFGRETQQHAGRLVLAIDAKDGVIATHGWQETSSRQASGVAREVTDWPLAALLYTDIARDGMLGGANVAATASLAAATRVPVLASGGVGSLADIEPLLHKSIAGVILGRSLHEGKVDLREALRLIS